MLLSLTACFSTRTSHHCACRVITQLPWNRLPNLTTLKLSHVPDGKTTVVQILLRMPELRALTLTQCNNLPFVFALNPARNPSNTALCPALEELTLYVEDRNAYHIPELVAMVKQRASRGARLRSIILVSLDERVLGKEVFKLRDHVAHVSTGSRRCRPSGTACQRVRVGDQWQHPGRFSLGLLEGLPYILLLTEIHLHFG